MKCEAQYRVTTNDGHENNGYTMVSGHKHNQVDSSNDMYRFKWKWFKNIY